jgi:uncharacterized protein (TIGR04255 family)
MKAESNNILPDYEKPPVIEVVCGILFEPIKALTAPYIGVLWEKFKSEYPRCKEVAPLVPVIERFDDAGALDQASLGEIFSLPRAWFETSDGNGLIQVQRDRFLHNWKKERDEDIYPHYGYVIGNFRKCLATFEEFLEENQFNEIKPVQYELTYVNHIPQGDAWDTLGNIKNVFPDFAWRGEGNRFLPVPEVINWQTSVVLPERCGRLHASIRLGKRRTDRHPILLFELTARGVSSERSKAAMWRWFDMAHEWIVRGFTDLTSEKLHKSVWRRRR